MFKIWKYLLSILALITATIWLAVLAYPQSKLRLIACDVGQGDAFLAVYGQTQILIDGGPNQKVLDCLSRYMPFWDRTIEGVVLTHPQKDHMAGLIDVFQRYNVKVFLASPIASSSQEFEVLKKLVGGSDIKIVNPTSGMIIRFDLIQLDVLHPSEEFILSAAEGFGQEIGKNILGAYTTKRDLNDFSIVAILRYKNFDALFTGDIGPVISNQLSVNPLIRQVEYIKIPHHGSKNGISQDLLEAVNPKIGVISAGKDNQYGHPQEEVLVMLKAKDVTILRTDEMGDVEVQSDGESFWVEK